MRITLTVAACAFLGASCTSRGPTSPSAQTVEATTPTPAPRVTPGPPFALVVSTHATGSDFDRLPIPMITEVDESGHIIGMAAIAATVLDHHGFALVGEPLAWTATRGTFRIATPNAGRGGRGYAEFLLEGGTAVVTIQAGTLTRSLLFHAP